MRRPPYACTGLRQRASSRPVGRALSILGALCLAGQLAACGPEPDDRLSTLLITLDTTRADALPCYGNSQGKMPFLDAFAEQSLVYDFAHTVAPLTLPSHASMLTGLYPLRHSVRINAPRPLPAAAWTLAEAAQAAGIQTAAFVSASVLNAPMGLAQGFDHYGGVEGQLPTGFRELERPAGEVVLEALEWLAQRDKARPFFIWLHLFDPHAPYETDKEFRGLTPNAYFDELAYVDHHLGILFDELKQQGILQKSLVVVCADHGEGFGEHGEDKHGWLTYEGVLRVPLMLRYPDALGAGKRSKEVVSVVDIGPTLAAAMELSLGDDLDGLSLYRNTLPADRGVYFESYQGYEAQRWSPISGWLTKTGKYIHSSAPEWYDSRLDTEEKYNLVKSIDTTPYRAAISSLAQRERLAPSDQLVDAEQASAIEALGYAEASSEDTQLPEPLAETSLPIPREMIQDERLLRQAMLLHTQAKFQEARPILQGILERNPMNPVAAEVLGYGLNSEGLYAEAEALLGALSERGVRWPNVLFLLGHALQSQGKLEAARAAYQQALAEDPAWQPAIEALQKL